MNFYVFEYVENGIGERNEFMRFIKHKNACPVRVEVFWEIGAILTMEEW